MEATRKEDARVMVREVRCGAPDLYRAIMPWNAPSSPCSPLSAAHRLSSAFTLTVSILTDDLRSCSACLRSFSPSCTRPIERRRGASGVTFFSWSPAPPNARTHEGGASSSNPSSNCTWNDPPGATPRMVAGCQ